MRVTVVTNNKTIVVIATYNNFIFVRTWVISKKIENNINMTCDEQQHSQPQSDTRAHVFYILIATHIVMVNHWHANSYVHSLRVSNMLLLKDCCLKSAQHD